MGLVMAALLGAMPAVAQRDTTLTKRWVGLHLERPLELEFYGDTMLVVNDRYSTELAEKKQALSASFR